MITAVIGHRGTGKTELMHRLQFYLRDQNVQLLDLDIEIEKKIGKTIRDLFFEHGEEYFRELERQVFLEICQRSSSATYIVLGAGFDLSVIPDEVKVLWVRRVTDVDGRIFMNRPRLEPQMTPLEEFRQRASVREENYRARADEIYLMPEGMFENRHRAMAVEKDILTAQVKQVGGFLTLMPDIFSSQKRWHLFKNRFSGKGLQMIELRDDFLTSEQMLQALDEMPQEHFLLSLRKPFGEDSFWLQEEGQNLLSRFYYVDVAWELGATEELLKILSDKKTILSLHSVELDRDFLKWENQVHHLKWAPQIYGYPALMKAHFWQQEKPAGRSFLPRSANGRWQWYRRLQKGEQWINFWKEGEGSAGDQPALWDWLMTPSKPQKFAAVLGDPVAHSFTPLEHSDFFAKKNCPVFSIQISRDEWSEALPILQQLGLSYAAVTAPHKESAASLLRDSAFKAVNTLYWSSKKSRWLGTSTDADGFAALIEGVGMIAPLQKEIFVWGGGGVLEMLEKHLPHASYFSSRTGEPRKGSEDASGLFPKVVIWAAPRSVETQWPPKEWQPQMVFDLNYKEDSMGREYAQSIVSNYQSGLIMFTEQAQAQRAFWNSVEDENER